MKTRKPKNMNFWRRYRWVIAAGVAVAAALAAVTLMLSPPAPPAGAPLVTVYKSPTCGCCNKWVRHLQEAGFAANAEHLADLDAVRAELGVPTKYAACHTAVVKGYVIEGHVPVADIKRLLAERPKARGLAVPGMPIGSPGMEGPNPQAYDVLLLHEDGTVSVYAQHNANQHSR
jgi:hypothetical protein